MTILKSFPWAFLKNGFIASAGGRKGCNYSTYGLRPTPVLISKVVEFLQPEKCSVLIDMTFGAGGHTRQLLNTSKSVKILCLDRDPVAHAYATALQTEYPDQVVALRGKFSELPALLKASGYRQNSIDGILFDLGCSSMQFDAAERGFSLGRDGPLDMRMDGGADGGFTAADVLANAAEEDLHRIFKTYGEEKRSKKIARAICQTRFSFRPLTTTSELRQLVVNTLNNEVLMDTTGMLQHPSIKVFQALRLFVNNELNEINYGLRLARSYLKVGGVLVTISLNTLEDAIVKSHITGIDADRGNLPLKFYNSNATFDSNSLHRIQNTYWKALNKHVITPSQREIDSNPRCRSAKLRAAVKIS